MSNPPQISRIDSLTAEERRTLSLALAEARSRGMKLPHELHRKKIEWTIDDKGFFQKNNGVLYEARDKMEKFIKSPAPFSALFGGRGSGKTTAGAQKALRKIMEGKTGAVFNPDFENFKYSTWSELREWIPWNLVVPSQRHRARPEWEATQPFSIVFMNGAKMYCKGLRDPDSARGANVNWLWYDEGGRDETGLGWQIAIACVRLGDDPQAWTTTTPKGTEHWCYKFFVEQDIPEEAREVFEQALAGKNIPLLDYQFVSIEENKNNLSPTFYAQMLAMYGNGYLRARELEGQFADEGGVLGDRAWFMNKILFEMPENTIRRVRYWDLAASEKKITGKKTNDPDSTVGTRMSMSKDYPFCIEHQVSAKVLWHEIKQLIIRTAEEDGAQVEIYIEQEPGSGGKNQVAEIAGLPELAGYKVVGHLPKEFGDKVMRAQAWFSRAAMGMVYLVAGEWNGTFLDQLAGFPAGRHDDKIDSASGAFAALNGRKQWKEIPFMKI